MYISTETPADIDKRLRRVITQMRVKFYDEPYAFVESPLSQFPTTMDSRALAFIRDDRVWSQLVPSDDPKAERFAVFRCHFPAGLDNSGFVGWLASRFKMRLGTGVFVTCGQNQADGGIFDYWGVPLALGRDARQEMVSLLRGDSE